ncbi:hypothetical protein AAFF_G00027840 [Aldrovandia affinis]|uniref:Prion protein n=1 Tax=Aldrovandia affinis TaxID=143900 RepID=A0AAD7S6U9_9TELE|nr:hypothetical protein AAFF_G00027840 [Aldrovandia affinis]
MKSNSLSRALFCLTAQSRSISTESELRKGGVKDALAAELAVHPSILSAVMRQPSVLSLLSLSVLLLLQEQPGWAKRSSPSSSKKTSGSKGSSSSATNRKPSHGTNKQAGNYPRQPQNPVGGYPAGGSYPGRGGYPNQNPAGGNSKGFVKKAMLAAGVGAVAGMAVGYGLGRFPRPNFSFNNPQEEHHYNRYMYHKYGTHSTDENDFGRDYRYKEPSQSYDSYMENCMKRTDLLQQEGDMMGMQGDDPSVSKGYTAGPSAPSLGDDAVNATSSPETGRGEMVTGMERTSTPPQGTPSTHPIPPFPVGGAKEDETVSIMEIGYPELIEQMKARKCVEFYMVYSERYLEKQTGDRSRNEPRGNAPQQRCLCQEVVVLLTTTLMLLSSTFLLQ